MLSENLKKLRIEQRYTRRQLEELSGVSKNTIQYIEEKRSDNPRIKTVANLAKVLKVSIDKLIK